MYDCIYIFYLPSIILKIYKFLKTCKDHNNYVCGVKCITTYTNHWGEPKNASRGAYFL